MKKIKTLRLQRFRQFADTSVEIGDFNVLVGPNNCGKTTLLYAIRAFFLLMHGHVRFDGNPASAVYHKRFLASAEEVAPTPDIRELWHGQRAGKPITLSLTFDDGVTFGVSLRQQFGQIHVSAEDLPLGLNADTVASYLGIEVAFIPGLVGVLVTEPYATAARRNSLATQGRYSEIFRSSLHQLKTKDSALLKQINMWLSDLFGITVKSVDFNTDKDEFVTVKYGQKGLDFDVVSSGAGLQQVIQMLTYLYLKKPRILLIDEPDAHLHSKLQARLGELFRRVAKDLNAQVFLSTHSLDLVDTFSTNEVIVVDATKKHLAPIGDNAGLVSTLVDADIIDVSALSRLLSSRRLVVVEDKDQTILKALDKACGSLLYSSKSNSYVISARGVSNFRAVADLGRVLLELTNTRFEITFVQDRDGMPDFLVPPFLESQKQHGVAPHLLERHEIENYLLEPTLLAKAATRVGLSRTEEEVCYAIVEEAQLMKAEARRASRECAKVINRYLNAKDKIKDDDLDIKVDQWFDKLNINDLATVQQVFPGKELLPRVLTCLGGDGKQITRGYCVAVLDRTIVPHDMIAFLEKAGEGEGR